MIQAVPVHDSQRAQLCRYMFFVCRMDGLGPKACSLSVLLVTELVDESLEEHLPINSLRNQAVLLAQTPLVAMLDADMVVSRTLAESLADPVDAEVRGMACSLSAHSLPGAATAALALLQAQHWMNFASPYAAPGAAMQACTCGKQPASPL